MCAQSEISQKEIEFALFGTCSVYPSCYLVPNRNKCLVIQASGLECKDCSHYVNSSDEAKRYGQALKPILDEHLQKHHDFNRSEAWEEARHRILKHYDYTCVICGEKRSKGMVVHHVIEKSADYDLSPSNLVVVCKKCHDILHPLFLFGIWGLGWPNMDKVKTNLKEFYGKVKRASEQFKTPLGNIMAHLCLVCSEFERCRIGQHTLWSIQLLMQAYSQKGLASIAGLKNGMYGKTIEGRITAIGEVRMVETRYGMKRLAYSTLEDDTGKIQLNLWEDDVERVKEGDVIRVCNGYVKTYENRPCLNIPKDRGRILINPSDRTPSLLLFYEKLLRSQKGLSKGQE